IARWPLSAACTLLRPCLSAHCSHSMRLAQSAYSRGIILRVGSSGAHYFSNKGRSASPALSSNRRAANSAASAPYRFTSRLAARQMSGSSTGRWYRRTMTRQRTSLFFNHAGATVAHEHSVSRGGYYCSGNGLWHCLTLRSKPRRKRSPDGHDAITESLEIFLVVTSAHGVGVLVKMESISGPDVPGWIHTEEMDRPILDALRR